MNDPARWFAWTAMIVGACIIAVSSYTTMQIREITQTPIAEPPSPAPAPLPPPPSSPLPAPAPAPPMRPVDQAVFRFVELPQKEAKRADVEPRAPYRIDLLAEDGRIVAADVDLDRDGNIDEHFRLYNPQTKRFSISRGVSPEDNGEFTEHFQWKDGWVAADAETP